MHSRVAAVGLLLGIILVPTYQLVASGLVESITVRQIDGSATATADGGLYFCSKGLPSSSSYTSILCHTVQPGETLWGISEKYFGSGHLWQYWHLYDPTGNGRHVAPGSRIDPRALQEGSVIWLSHGDVLRPVQSHAEHVYILPGTNDIVAHSGSSLYINGELYDGGHGYISHVNFTPDGKNISYVVGSVQRQFVVNKAINPHVSNGCDWQSLTYSPTGEHYVIRNNTKCGPASQSSPDSFLVLSDLGNSKSYDYVDSLMWIDDETFAYRAKQGTTWVVVINHVEQEGFKYVDFLKVENGKLLYSAELADGSWVDRTVSP